MRGLAEASREPRRWLAGIRVDEVVVLQGAPLLGVAFALGSGARPTARDLLVFGLASGALVAHVFALNDWSEMSPEPHRRPLDRRETRALWVVLLLGSLSLFASIGLRPFLLAGAIALLSALYSAPPTRGKGAPVVASTLHLAGGALHFLLGYSFLADFDARGLLLAVFFGLTFAAGHLTQEVRDRDEDLRNGVRTNAVAFGKVPAFLAGLVLFTAADAFLCLLAVRGLAPLGVAAGTVALYPLHVAWSARALARGLRPDDVRRLQWKYRARYAAIGLLAAVLLLGSRDVRPHRPADPGARREGQAPSPPGWFVTAGA